MIQKSDLFYQIPTHKLTFNNFSHYRCIADILNLVVSAGLNFLEDSIKRLRKLIKTIRKLSKILEDFQQLATLDNKSFLVPILDCKTRWNSIYQMIKRACLLYKSINMLLVKHSSLKTYIPNKEDWQIYKDLVILLEQFNEATIELSSQTYSTIAHAQIILLALRNNLKSDRGEDFLLEEVVNTILSKYIEYFNLITEFLHISAFLDPRYKKLLSKKVSSFYQKLKHTSQQAQIMNDKAHKYWLFAEADKTIKLLDW
ncbi:7829_t:CDS:2 [Dentiscutata erythropus]|uniref:7829_t:CDS:1 n=1 Tax=Dentiscutata erythropus TaxID=1348616 RepID=A0A9N9NY14_9GLOM|nr:7829_t:CDS:2 [Dentiscutata erythropus]